MDTTPEHRSTEFSAAFPSTRAGAAWRSEFERRIDSCRAAIRDARRVAAVEPGSMPVAQLVVGIDELLEEIDELLQSRPDADHASRVRAAWVRSERDMLVQAHCRSS
jgi:hypothetical protein